MSAAKTKASRATGRVKRPKSAVKPKRAHAPDTDKSGEVETADPVSEVSSDELSAPEVEAAQESEGVRESEARPEPEAAPGAKVGNEAQEILAEPTLVDAGESDSQAAKRQEVLKNGLARANAEMETVRRRARDEKLLTILYANESLALQVLPVLDDFDRATEQAPKAGPEAAFVQGVEMIRRRLLKSLEDAGITRFSSAGKPFDPTRHQAVQIAPRPGTPPGTVLYEVEKGYMYHGKLLRAAKVVVTPAEKKERFIPVDIDAVGPARPAAIPAPQVPDPRGTVRAGGTGAAGLPEDSSTTIVAPPVMSETAWNRGAGNVEVPAGDISDVLAQAVSEAADSLDADFEFDSDSLDLNEVAAEEGFVEEHTNPESTQPKKVR